MREKRVRAAIVAAVAIAAVTARLAGADDVDEGIAAARAELGAVTQDEYEKIFGDRMAKLGQIPFRDQVYAVAAAVSKEAGWTVPSKPFVFKPPMTSGPVFFATWSSGKKAEAQPSVVILVTRFDTSAGAASKSKIGAAEVAHSDALALVQAISRAWADDLEKPPAAPDSPPADGAPPVADPVAKEAEADRQACVEAVKKTVGVAKVFAAFQGRLAGMKKRQRREWFAWTGEDATWVVCVRYDETVLAKSNGALTKGAYFLGNVHAYKGVSAK